MKSSDEQLRNRGYITEEDINEYANLDNSELLELLKSKEANKRTIATKLLADKNKLDNDLISLFCNMLVHEKKLYTKIELCNALSKAPAESAEIMVKYLGIIGNNQYKELPTKECNKKSYPLPRDIMARTLAHMNAEVLPELMGVLKTDNIKAIREAIDAIGFICFYNEKACSESVLNELVDCFNKYIEDDIIRWKMIRTFAGFNCKIGIDILKDAKEKDREEIIRGEAKRGLGIINRRN